MRFFNTSVQAKVFQRQAFKKEYVYRLENQVNSLYTYLHYYNPAWRLLNDYSYINQKGELITEDNIVTLSESDNNEIYKLNLNKLDFRWGYKNTSENEIQCGTSTLNIGATIYKKDAVDIDTEDLSHFVIYESSLAQFILWTFSIDKTHFLYNGQLVNEADYGLQFYVQLATVVPRYFYKNGNNGKFEILYKSGSGFKTDSLFDYNNKYNNTYQKWCGASSLLPQIVYKDNNGYEEIIADVIIHERINEYSVFLDKEQSTSSLERDIEVIFS